MSIEIISKDISLKADKISKEFELEFLEEKSLLEKEFEKEFEKFKLSLSSKFELELNLNKSQILGKANQVYKKTLLKTKSNIISDLKSSVLSSLLSLSKDDKNSLFELIILKVKNSKFNFDLIYSNKNDVSLIQKLVGIKIKVLEKKKFVGIYFENSKNMVGVSFSFEEILNQIYEENEFEILNSLFVGDYN